MCVWFAWPDRTRKEITVVPTRPHSRPTPSEGTRVKRAMRRKYDCLTMSDRRASSDDVGSLKSKVDEGACGARTDLIDAGLCLTFWTTKEIFKNVSVSLRLRLKFGFDSHTR